MARLLSDEAAAPPFLEYRPYAVAYLPGKKGDDLCPMLIWKRGRVRDSAARALDLLTGMDFRQRSFADWWKENAIAKDRLWFWRQRARRMLSAGTPRPDMLQQLREEIRRQPPETEAKMRLLLSESSDNPLGEIDRDQSLFQGPLALRVSDNRLLELFEGKGLWPDVVWDEEFETRLITRLCQTGSPLLRVENLRVLQERLSRTTGWIARSALISSIGALMGGDRGTEYLRTEAIHEKELFVREEVIRELIRRDLSGNSTFIEARFFADNDFSGSPDVKQAILQELGKPPLSPLKRDLLCRLVLDPRLGPFLTRPSKVMGDDMWRKYAIWSLNVHAGRELMSPSSEEEYALTKPDTSKKALTDFLAKVQDLKNGRQK
ncbi:MAG TPA: hypothetical protein VN915_06665 [Elusimicrobiota bacterium]|nr:hypothetical protein [Elusimicrobiota bacterium]